MVADSESKAARIETPPGRETISPDLTESSHSQVLREELETSEAEDKPIKYNKAR